MSDTPEAAAPSAAVQGAAAIGAATAAAPSRAPARPWELVPDWLTNLAAVGWRVVVVGLLAVVVLLICNAVWTTTASIIVAGVVSAVFAPAVIRLRSQGKSRNSAAAIVWVTAIGIIAGLLLVLVLALLPAVVELLEALQTGVTQARAAWADASLSPEVSAALQAGLDALKSILGDLSGQIVAQAAQIVTILIIATFLLFFFLRDGDKAWVWVFQNVSDHKRDAITSAGDEALDKVGGYLRGTTVLAAIMASTAFLFMWLLNVPLALPLALFVFLGTFVPYFGGIVATIAILLVAYGAQGLWTSAALLALFAVRNAVVAYVVRPQLYSRTVRLHPAMVLVALPAGFEVAGVIGLFAAVPIIAVVLSVWSSVVLLLEPERRPDLPALVPPSLDRAAQISWRLLVALGVIGLVAVGATLVPLVVLPVTVGLVGAATLVPGVQWLQQRGHARGRASAMVVGGTLVIVAAVLLLATASLVQQLPEIAAQASAGAQQVSSSAGGQLDLGTAAVSQGGVMLVRTLVTALDSIVSMGVVVVIGTLLAFYMLRDGRALWSRAIARIGGARRVEVDAAGSRAVSVLGGYMVGTAAISFVGAASQWVIMVVLGLPLAMPVFVLSFILCFIPYIGGFISTGIAFLITVVAGTPEAILIMLIWTVVFNIVQGNVVSPLVYGKTVHLHPAIVMVAIPAAASVAGMMGMFLVVPVLGVVAATWRTVMAILDDETPDATGLTAPTDLAAPTDPPAPSPGQMLRPAPGPTPS
jgi:predicted PurR-regulated permease PerM